MTYFSSSPALYCGMVFIFIFSQGLTGWRGKKGQKGPREDIQGKFVIY